MSEPKKGRSPEEMRAFRALIRANPELSYSKAWRMVDRAADPKPSPCREPRRSVDAGEPRPLHVMALREGNDE